MQKTIQTWHELLALPRFKVPGSVKWWKIDAINDDGDMGLFCLKTPMTDEWEFVAHVSEPEPGKAIVAVNHPFGLKFISKIHLHDINYNPSDKYERGVSYLDKYWPQN